MKINVVELATLMAANAINEEIERHPENFPNDVLTKDAELEGTCYTDEAQKIFDEEYDKTYDLIISCKS